MLACPPGVLPGFRIADGHINTLGVYAGMRADVNFPNPVQTGG